MKINKTVKMVECEYVEYVAEDGKIFNSRFECEKHEMQLKYENDRFRAGQLKIDDLDDVIPINCDGLPNDNNIFRWYKLKSDDDFKILENAYIKSELDTPQKYPTIYCVETYGYDIYDDDAYGYDIEMCKIETIEFWKKFGYNILFLKKQGKCGY